MSARSLQEVERAMEIFIGEFSHRTDSPVEPARAVAAAVADFARQPRRPEIARRLTTHLGDPVRLHSLIAAQAGAEPWDGYLATRQSLLVLERRMARRSRGWVGG
ncbi:hypothetical protein [Miltoncostaea oceani]|uniref:hypothetical protein n=1 Tax=Miltoncostaea oceani TaxID=2843216 RepID=UPI001C3DE7EE|nr:hypothetical protein [Miltoncostaea oceani]